MDRVAWRAVVLALLLSAIHGCGEGGAGTVPPIVATSNFAGWVSSPAGGLLRWNEYDDSFPWPPKQSWNNSFSGTLDDHNPHHRGEDLFLKEGNSAPIRAKFHYGDLRIDLKGEKVGLWLRKVDSASWVFVADGVTDDDGRVEFAWPSSVLQGTGFWFARTVAYGDLSTADSFVRIVSSSVPCVVSDIDGTLTTSDWEMVKQILGDFLDLNYLPRMYGNANKVLHSLAKSGFEIVYLTARPYWLSRSSRRWLQTKGFPVGMVYTYPGALPPIGSATSDAKRDRLLELKAQGAEFLYAFGNAETDISAYAQAGIPATSTYIIGPNAGQGGTIALAKYGDLFGTLVPAPDMPYRAVLLIVDGLRPDALRTYLDTIAGAESALKKTFGTAVEVQKCATTAPSITWAANASIATGRNPASHGLPSNQFLDRKTGKPYAFDGGPMYQVDQVVGVYKGEGLSNGLLQVQTIYEQMSSSGRYGLVTSHQYFKGAEVLQPSYLQLITYLTDARDYDRKTTDRVLKRLEGQDIPDLVTIYWSGLDNEAHSKGQVGGIELAPPGLANQQIDYLKEVIDPELARVRERLEKLGVLGETVFVLCSDHGHRDVHDDDAHSIKTDLFGIDPELEDVIEDSPYDDLFNKPTFLEGDFDSHVGLSAGILHIALRNRATNQWKDAPNFEQDVLPVIGSIQQHRMTGELIGAVEEILMREAPALPYRVVRPTRVKIHFDSIKVLDDEDWFGPGELNFRLRANGKILKKIGTLTASDGDTLAVGQSFEVDVMPGMTLTVQCEGEDEDFWFFKDSLGTAEKPYASKSSLPSGSVTVESSNGDFLLTFHVEVVPLDTYSHPEYPGWGNSCPLTLMSAEYVDGPNRIEKFAHSDRSGDILLMSTFRKGFYFGNKNASNHGSLYPEDSYQAFVVGGAPVVQSQTLVGGQVVDIAATLAHILGFELRNKEGVSKVTASELPQLP